MSFPITLTVDILVAVLLVGTIVSSMRLSRRIARMKADEAGMRQTISDLVVASSTAERAVVGLRATLDECDRTLADRLATAERYATDLSVQVAAGATVIEQISAIVAQASGGAKAPAQVEETPVRVDAPVTTQSRLPVEIQTTPNHERLGAAAAAALAVSERALGRLRSKAA
jgi:low affinity Fe/Cu permease